MNIESTSKTSETKTSKTNEAQSNSSSTSSTNSTSFKEELELVSTNEPNEAKQSEKAEDKDKNLQKLTEENVKKLENKENDKLISLHAQKKFSPYDKLNSEIQTIKSFKNNQNCEIYTTSNITEDKDYSSKNGLDHQDIAFYLNLTSADNQQIALQATPSAATSNVDNNCVTVKSEATQQTVQVSQVLMDSLADSMKTGKSIRVDFGNDIAVVMKVDKEGTVSANFIPSSAAVENYLRNNIASLRQTFEDQNLPYNELSYNEHQKKDQNEQQKQNKEKNNE